MLAEKLRPFEWKTVKSQAQTPYAEMSTADSDTHSPRVLAISAVINRMIEAGRLQLQPDGTRWRTGGGSEEETGEMQWVASTLHATSEHGVSSITTAHGAHLGCQ